MSATAASPWDQEVKSGGGLYLKIEPNSSARVRFIGMPIAFQEEFSGKVSDRWAAVVIEKTIGPDNKPQRAVKGFKFGVMIFKAIQTLWRNEDWGNPEEYDVTITRTGSDKETKYSVVPSPKKPISDEERTLVTEANIDLSALFLKNGNGVAAAGASPDEYDPFQDE